MVSKFLSNVLYTQPFDPRDDITVSFLYSAPGNTGADFLLLQGGQFDEAILELQTDNDLMVLNFTEENSQFNGLGVFLVLLIQVSVWLRIQIQLLRVLYLKLC